MICSIFAIGLTSAQRDIEMKRTIELLAPTEKVQGFWKYFHS